VLFSNYFEEDLFVFTVSILCTSSILFIVEVTVITCVFVMPVFWYDATLFMALLVCHEL